MVDLKAIEERHHNLRGECFDCYRMLNADRPDVSKPPVFSASVWPCDAAVLISYVKELREALRAFIGYGKCAPFTTALGVDLCRTHGCLQVDGECPVSRARRLANE